MNINVLKNKIIAHRGYHDESIPENSLKAFKKARDNNYPIELDIRLLKDNNIIVFHDNNLKRMTGIDKDIKDITYNDIKNIKLLNSNECIPLLIDVLKLIDGKVPLIIEIKSDKINHKVEESLLSILHNYKGDYLIKSFNPFSIKYISFKNKSINTGLLYSCKRKKKRFLFNNLGLLLLYTKVNTISCNINCLPNKLIDKNKLFVLGYTIKSKSDLEYAKKYCDAFVCENIDKLEL